jgi:hypothetical protein
MALIHYWPFESDTKDAVGNGTDAGGSIGTALDEKGRAGAFQVNFDRLDSDFTISFDLYRGGYTADWCVDFGTNNPHWGTGGSGSGYFLLYNQNYGRPYLHNGSTDSKDPNLFTDTKETIGVWYHAEIHRHDNTHSIYINGELKDEWEGPNLPYPDHCFFFNAGSYQTGGGYVKELKIYPTAFVESLGERHLVYDHLGRAYGMPPPPEE